MADIKLTNLNKSYGAVHILKDVKLGITSGEFIVFVGPSGCGKSTLLRTICGLESITSGTLEIDHQVVNEVPPRSAASHGVPVLCALSAHERLREHRLRAREPGPAPRRDQAEGREGGGDAAAHALSGPPPQGLVRRPAPAVAIGRAIVRGAKVFLFDEPLSNLDAALRVQTRMEIAKLKRGMRTRR